MILGLSKNSGIEIVFEPFVGHEIMIEYARNTLQEGLWSGDPDIVAASMAYRRRPRIMMLWMHTLFSLFFLLDIILALVPFLSRRRVPDLGRVYTLRWLRFRFSILISTQGAP